MKQKSKNIIGWILIILGFLSIGYLTVSILASNWWQLVIAAILIIGGIKLKE